MALSKGSPWSSVEIEEALVDESSAARATAEKARSRRVERMNRRISGPPSGPLHQPCQSRVEAAQVGAHAPAPPSELQSQRKALRARLRPPAPSLTQRRILR